MKLKTLSMKFILIFNLVLIWLFGIPSYSQTTNNLIQYKGLKFFLFDINFLASAKEKYIPLKKNVEKKVTKKTVKKKTIKLIKKKKILSDELKLLNTGKELFGNKSYKSAEISFVEFLQKYPDSQHKDTAIFLLGKIMIASNRLDEALMYFNKIVDELKNSKYISKAYYNSANIYYLKKDYNSAEKLLTRMQFERISKYYTYKSYILLGDVYMAVNKISSAEKNYKKALTVDKKYAASALFKLGRLYEDNNELHNFELAKKFYKKIIENYPDSDYYLKAQQRLDYVEKNFLQFGE